MRKSVSANALSDMALDAVKYVPVQNVATCVIEFLNDKSMSTRDFGSCLATPLELKDPPTSVFSNRFYHDKSYNQRFQELYEIVKRRKQHARFVAEEK
jgi:hypothetical protein